MYKTELHVHTSDGDIYAKHSGEEIVKMYADKGYSSLVITNHYFSPFFTWFKDELDDADHKKIIDRYLKGYYIAKNEGEKLGVSVLPGAEVRVRSCANDYLIYGLNEKDFYDLPILCNLKNIDELVDTIPEHALIVWAHPFRNKCTTFTPDRLFGLEGFNYGNEPFRNQMAKDFAKHYGKPITSGSDFHGKNALAKGGIISNKKILTPRDLTDVLKSGEYTLIETERK